MNHYEQAALVFYSEKNHVMASNFFSQALEIEPKNTMLWYGLGDSLCHISIQTGKKDLYAIGLSCVKTSYTLDSNNKYASAMLERMKKNPEIGAEFIEQLTVADLNLSSKFIVDISNKKFISYFNELKHPNSKLKLIMLLGDTKNIKFYDLLKHCVLNDPDQNIRFAALKRISYFQSQRLKEEIFDKIIERNDIENYEPYFSIVLSSIGEDWTSEFINPDFANQNNQENVFSKEAIEKSINEEELKAIIALSLVKYNKEELKQLLEQQNHRTIAFYLTNGMNDNGIATLIDRKILNRQGKISELGWKHIEEFLKIDLDKPAQNQTKKTPPLKQKNNEVTKKWWEIWK
jgi:hypothetical protein